MTALTRALELIATMPKCAFVITKYGPRSYVIQCEDLEFGTLSAPKTPRKAIGSGESLQGAAEAFVASALRVGLIEDSCPETQPGGAT